MIKHNHKAYIICKRYLAVSGIELPIDDYMSLILNGYVLDPRQLEKNIAKAVPEYDLKSRTYKGVPSGLHDVVLDLPFGKELVRYIPMLFIQNSGISLN
jgi:hypothetical protein